MQERGTKPGTRERNRAGGEIGANDGTKYKQQLEQMKNDPTLKQPKGQETRAAMQKQLAKRLKKDQKT